MNDSHHSANKENCAAIPAGLKVLVVDDVSVNVKLATSIVKKLGGIPTQAINGLEAIDKACAEAFDVILMDILMPQCDGVQAAKAIREFERINPERTPSIIIAITADTRFENRQNCQAAGMGDFMTKPMRLDLLVKVLLKHLPSSAGQ